MKQQDPHENPIPDGMTDDQFANQLGSLLRESEDSVDMATRSQLNRARHKVLEQQPPAFFSWFHWTAVGGSVCAALLMVVVLLNPAAQNSDAMDSLSTADMAIALENNWDLYDELEFYEWLNEIEHGQT